MSDVKGKRSPQPCGPSCPGWAVFNAPEAPEIQRCDECWQGVEGAPTDADFAVLPECQAALAAALRYDVQAWIGRPVPGREWKVASERLEDPAEWMPLLVGVALGVAKEQMRNAKGARLRVVFAGTQSWACCWEVRLEKPAHWLDSVHYNEMDATEAGSRLRAVTGANVAFRVAEVWRTQAP